MIGTVAGARALPANVRQDIVERSDGAPLFVEETTKAVLETEGDRRGGRGRPGGPVGVAGGP